MDLANWRKTKGLSQADVAIQLRRTKGRISTLEAGDETWPVELAIAVDRLTKGEVPVAQLRPDLHDVRVVQPESGAQA